jgi:transcriptional antiterminator
MPLEEVYAQEGTRKEPEIQQQIPITIRTIYTSIKDVTSMCKWYAHDQFKPKNQVKEVPPSEEALSRI